nr:thiamine diphosphokinase [uncultured Cetobacterium sp.]
MMTNAYIFLNGEFSENINFYNSLNIKHLFCADGGAKKAMQLGIIPKEVWGDFDSLDDSDLQWLKKNNVTLNKFNADKDFTDGELLIQYVSTLNYEKIYILGGTGGRIDHELTNLNLCFKYPKIIFKTEKEDIFPINFNHIFESLVQYTVSFIPFSDQVTNLTLNGFKYPLKNFLLNRGDSICISNIITDKNAQIEFESGKILCILNSR